MSCTPIAKLTAAPTFTIQKRPDVIFRLDDYVEKDMMTGSQAALLRIALTERKNVLVSGGTSSGKTTLLNALLVEQVIAYDHVMCWFAPGDMKLGDRIRNRIDEIIHIHDKPLLVSSKESIARQWV